MIRDDAPSTDQLPMLDYAYTHEETQATTGYFSCVPPSDLDFAAALTRLEAAPMDDFLHQHLLRLLSAEKSEELTRLAATCYDAANDAFTRPVLAALLLECGILLPRHAQACAGFPADAGSRLAHVSPALYLRAASQFDAEASAAWSELFRGNICEHHALPRPSEAGIAPLFTDEEIEEAAMAMAAHAGSMTAQHARLRRAIDIGVQQPDPPPLPRQRHREVRGQRGFPHAPLARADGEDPRHAADRGRPGLRRRLRLRARLRHPHRR